MSIVGVKGKKYHFSRVWEKAPQRFSCVTEQDSVSEIAEVTHPEG